jgi:glyoxylase-like metal-dependent hydrolase (beta-lactamase superfamily II)
MTARRMIGDIAVTALSDGPFPAPLDSFVDFERTEAERLTGRKIHEQIVLPLNCYLLRLGTAERPKWALVDAGCGPTMGADLGQLPNALRACGVTPDAVDYVLLTHIHPDHSTGLIDGAGRAVFPNAELVLHEEEAAFWLDRDESAGATERVRRNIAKAHKTTAPYRDRMRRVRDGEVLGGVNALPLPGHTPGHTGWLVQSGRDATLIWGDVVHLADVQVPRPEAALVFDVDPEAARATRRRIFDQVAADRLRVAGAHLDFPGFGHIVRNGASYRFEPEE